MEETRDVKEAILERYLRDSIGYRKWTTERMGKKKEPLHLTLRVSPRLVVVVSKLMAPSGPQLLYAWRIPTTTPLLHGSGELPRRVGCIHVPGPERCTPANPQDVDEPSTDDGIKHTSVHQSGRQTPSPG